MLFFPHIAYSDTYKDDQHNERDENPVTYFESEHTASLPEKICQSIPGFFMIGVQFEGVTKIILGVARHSHP